MFCNDYTRVFIYFLGVCKCFRCMVQVFQLFWMYVASVSDVRYKCFSRFGHMLKVFHLDVTKVYLVLHMLQWDPPTACATVGDRARA
jgi:hypothetical protein